MNKIWRLFNPWYMLEVNHRGEELQLIVKSFKKKTPKHIIGITNKDEYFELKSETPMDYYIKEYRDDLE